MYLRAMHAVNALVMLLFAMFTARSAWRLVNEGSSGRKLLTGTMAVIVVGRLVLISARGVPNHGIGEAAPKSLAAATEQSVPEYYRAMENPMARNDGAVLTVGRNIATRQCSCHGADLFGNSHIGGPNLRQSGAERSDQFLMWAISEGSRDGMPAWKSRLSEEQRWQVVTFIKSLGE